VNKKEKYAFIIPAYNPDERLLEVVQGIQQKSNNLIFILNDGSNLDSEPIFKSVENFKNVILMEHSVNMGKGASLKAVFNKILTEYKIIQGVVTLDSDGQHSITDCFRVLAELENYDYGLVLGYRNFSKDVPFKSYFGNKVSKFIYKSILGRNFQDTQTGLRGLSKSFMRSCLSIKSNRFEFETEQLALAVNNKISIFELPIQTIYIEENKSSSFRPIIDSFKIYFVLLRYFFAAIVSALVDLIVFSISIILGSSILVSNIWGRSVSLLFNFVLLRNIVFQDKKKSFLKFLAYIGYVYIIALISATLQEEISNHFDLQVILIKIMVETPLSIINFSFLRTIVFRSKK